MRRTISSDVPVRKKIPLAKGADLTPETRRSSLPEMASGTNISAVNSSPTKPRSRKLSKESSRDHTPREQHIPEEKTVHDKLEKQKKLAERPDTKQRDEEAFRAKLEARKRSAEPGCTEATNFVPRATFESVPPTNPPKPKSKSKSRTSDKRLSIDDSIHNQPTERPDRRDPTTKVKFSDRKVVTIGEPDVPRALSRHLEKPEDIQAKRKERHSPKKVVVPEPVKPIEPPKPV